MTPEPSAPLAAVIVFAALGDATRLAIVGRLGAGAPLSVTELTRRAGLTRQGVSKHLRVLERAGVVARRRVGREARFELRPAPLLESAAYLEGVAGQWDAAIARLRALVEDAPDGTAPGRDQP